MDFTLDTDDHGEGKGGSEFGDLSPALDIGRTGGYHEKAPLKLVEVIRSG
jgi:hypothetical protein